MSGDFINDRYRRGSWLVECQRSAKWCYADETVKEARTGLRVHKDWADPRHPQEKVRGVHDDMTVPFASPPIGVWADDETAVTFTHGDNFIDPINDPVLPEDL